jgi:hypothetical protein
LWYAELPSTAPQGDIDPYSAASFCDLLTFLFFSACVYVFVHLCVNTVPRTSAARAGDEPLTKTVVVVDGEPVREDDAHTKEDEARRTT